MDGLNVKDIIDSYNQKANERNISHVQDWKKIERDLFLNFLKENNCINLLELGAGPGRDSFFFKEQGLNTLSTDISPEMVKLCREKGLAAEVMSFAKLNIPDVSYDSIWALNCLLHVPKKELKNVLKEIKRVLKPSGLFYFGVYGGEDFEGIWEDDPYEPKRFFSFYEDEAIKKILSEFFSIEYFKVIPRKVVGGNYHFQSIILRSKLGD
ncbi:class I SAM-dependent methyltransferase [Ornithinibacillus scapharcae]|uniref:class I SAM-dependent methyltransferase n=1 Tax=Ornithinibacillus scapharcae TaxID=1147159 RepID=UPI000225BC9E|nr:class I SAM-dependent methyltransferase [Ornithinibacillus scapharcae]